MWKINIDKIVDVPKLFIRIWISLWVIEIIMLIGKFCFNLWYPIVSDLEWFISLCNFLDTNTILRMSIYFILYVLSNNLWYLTTTKRMKYTNIIELIVLNLLIISNFFIKNVSNILGLIIEIGFLIGIPITYNLRNKVFTKKVSILLPIIAYLLLNIWQMNIFFIRDVSTVLTNAPTLVALLLQIDFYVFILITWTGVNYYGNLRTRMVLDKTNNSIESDIS